MSMENELKRIADALERIETKIGAPLKVEEPKPVEKRKSTKAVPEVQVEAEKGMTGAELMSYCNSKLVAIKDVAQRTGIIKQVVALFKEKFGVTAIRELPDEKVSAAKQAFDRLLGEE